MNDAAKYPLTQEQAATYLGVTQETLRKWRRDGYGPKHLRLSLRFIRYRVEDLDAFLAVHVVVQRVKK